MASHGTKGGVRGRRQGGKQAPRSREGAPRSGLVQAGLRLTAEEYEKAHAAAAAADLSFAAYLGVLIRRDELDERGRPLWAENASEYLPGLEASA